MAFLEKKLQLLQNVWLPAWLPNGKDLIQKCADSFAHDSRLPSFVPPVGVSERNALLPIDSTLPCGIQVLG